MRLRDDDSGAAATLWADQSYPWLQLFTGDTLPAGRARAGLAVEPMTCGPDAFNTGDGLIRAGARVRSMSASGASRPARSAKVPGPNRTATPGE